MQATVVQAETIGRPQPIGDGSWHCLFLWHAPCDSSCIRVFPWVRVGPPLLPHSRGQPRCCGQPVTFPPLSGALSGLTQSVSVLETTETKVSLYSALSTFAASTWTAVVLNFTHLFPYFQISALSHCLLVAFSRVRAVSSYCWYRLTFPAVAASH